MMTQGGVSGKTWAALGRAFSESWHDPAWRAQTREDGPAALNAWFRRLLTDMAPDEEGREAIWFVWREEGPEAAFTLVWALAEDAGEIFDE